MHYFLPIWIPFNFCLSYHVFSNDYFPRLYIFFFPLSRSLSLTVLFQQTIWRKRKKKFILSWRLPKSISFVQPPVAYFFFFKFCARFIFSAGTVGVIAISPWLACRRLSSWRTVKGQEDERRINKLSPLLDIVLVHISTCYHFLIVSFI